MAMDGLEYDNSQKSLATIQNNNVALLDNAVSMQLRPRRSRSLTKDDLYVYYDEGKTGACRASEAKPKTKTLSQDDMCLNWSPKYKLGETSTPGYKANVADYALNRRKCLAKKIDACDRPCVSLVIKPGGNGVIEYSTLGFELVRTILMDFYLQCKQYHVDIVQKTDENNCIENDKVSIHLKTKAGNKGKYQYTVNFYRTTCKVLINGSQFSKFLTQDYPKIETILMSRYKSSDERKLKHILIQASEKGEEQQLCSPKLLPPDELNVSTDPDKHNPSRMFHVIDNVMKAPENQAYCDSPTTDLQTVTNTTGFISKDNVISHATSPLSAISSETPWPINVDDPESKSSVFKSQGADHQMSDSEPDSVKDEIVVENNKTISNTPPDSDFSDDTDEDTDIPKSKKTRKSSKLSRVNKGKGKRKSAVNSGIEKRLDRIEKAISILNQQAVGKVDQFCQSHSELQKSLSSANDKIQKLEKKIGHTTFVERQEFTRQIDKIRQELNSTKANFKVEKQNMDIDTKISLQTQTICTKTDKLEDNVRSLQNKISKLEKKTDLTDMDKKINDLEAKINQMTTPSAAHLADMDKKFNELGAKIDKMTTPITAQDAKKDNGTPSDKTFQSSVKHEKGSYFQAFCRSVHTREELDIFVAETISGSRMLEAATHKVVAYKYQQDGKDVTAADDDGELGAGEVLLDLLNGHSIHNIAILVCRWYGNVHLYQRRFELMKHCAVEALTDGNLMPQSIDRITQQEGQETTTPTAEQSASKTIIFCDSTGATINVNRMIPNKSAIKVSCPTLDSATVNIQKTPETSGNIVIQTGINDIGSVPMTQLRNKITKLIDTAKSFHPTAKICITSILPYRSDVRSTEDINNFIEHSAKRKRIIYVNTAAQFKGSSGLYRDEKHPNKRGTGVLVSCLKSSMGLKYSAHPNYSALTKVNRGAQSSMQNNYNKNNETTTSFRVTEAPNAQTRVAHYEEPRQMPVPNLNAQPNTIQNNNQLTQGNSPYWPPPPQYMFPPPPVHQFGTAPPGFTHQPFTFGYQHNNQW